MRKKIITLSLLVGLSFNNWVACSASILPHSEYTYLNCYTNKNNLERPHDKEKIEKFWTSENESFLSASEKETLNGLRAKVESGQNLTVEERDILSSLRGEAIRKKLGDARFERYKKLIERRAKQEKGLLEIELTKEEKAEIYNFEKEIKGK